MTAEPGYLQAVAVSLAEREQALGGPAPDGPSSAEVSVAGTMFAEFLSGATPSSEDSYGRLVAG
jgi:hypothetical protein